MKSLVLRYRKKFKKMKENKKKHKCDRVFCTMMIMPYYNKNKL